MMTKDGDDVWFIESDPTLDSITESGEAQPDKISSISHQLDYYGRRPTWHSP